MLQGQFSTRDPRYRNLLSLLGVGTALVALWGCETGNRTAYMRHRRMVVDPLSAEQIAALDARDDFAVALVYAPPDIVSRD